MTVVECANAYQISGGQEELLLKFQITFDQCPATNGEGKTYVFSSHRGSVLLVDTKDVFHGIVTGSGGEEQPVSINTKDKNSRCLKSVMAEILHYLGAMHRFEIDITHGANVTLNINTGNDVDAVQDLPEKQRIGNILAFRVLITTFD